MTLSLSGWLMLLACTSFPITSIFRRDSIPCQDGWRLSRPHFLLFGYVLNENRLSGLPEGLPWSLTGQQPESKTRCFLRGMEGPRQVHQRGEWKSGTGCLTPSPQLTQVAHLSLAPRPCDFALQRRAVRQSTQELKVMKSR